MQERCSENIRLSGIYHNDVYFSTKSIEDLLGFISDVLESRVAASVFIVTVHYDGKFFVRIFVEKNARKML
jgi:hypothetical protein